MKVSLLQKSAFAFVLVTLGSTPVQAVNPSDCTAPPAGLVAWWRAEGNAIDTFSGVAGVGVNTTFDVGKVGQAFRFNGTDSYVEVASRDDFEFTGPFTVEAWVNFESTGHNNTIVTKGAVVNGNADWTFFVSDSNRLRPHVMVNGFWAWFDCNTPLVTGTWYHAVMVYDGTHLQGYLNGVLDGSGNISGPVQATEGTLRIGAYRADETGNKFHGRIDDLTLYNRALSPNEIQALYNAGSGGKCAPSPSAYLIDVDFVGTDGPSGKVGVAALGQSSSDYWNWYTRNDGSGGWRTFGSLTNLKLVDGTVTQAGMTIANAPGAWGSGSSDLMYDGYIYPFSGNATITITNLPAGEYDVLPYSTDGNFDLASGDVSYGTKHTRDLPLSNPPVWTEGVQYAGFTNVQVNVGQPLVLTVHPGLDGYAIIAGLQISRSSVSNNPPPPSADDCVPAPSGLVSWWRAENNAADSADSNPGTLQSGASFAAGRVGQAFSFDGINDSVNVPQAANLNVGNQVTIEFWMKAAPGNAMNSYQGLVTSDFYGIEIANGYAVGPLGVNFFISSDSGASVSPGSFPDTATINGGGAVVSAGQWHHVAGTYDGTKLQLYIDGQPWGNPQFHSGPISPMLANSFVSIGSEDGRTTCPFCVSGRYFNGLIDEPSIYNRALSAGEILAIFNAGSAGKCSDVPTNDAPVAKMIVRGAIEFPGVDGLLAIAPDNISALLALDASQSGNPDNESLQYTWLDGTNIFSTDIRTTNQFALGTHELTLLVTAGFDLSVDAKTVKVITPAEAIALLIEAVNNSGMPWSKKLPLIVSLRNAAASFEHGNGLPGINKLQAFQNKIQAPGSSLDPEIARQLNDMAQLIVGALMQPEVGAPLSKHAARRHR